MKSKVLELARWFPTESDGSGNLYIDWPAVQRQTSKESLNWLLNQEKTQCQLIVETRPDDPYHYLIAEFYSEILATEYLLRWAK